MVVLAVYIGHAFVLRCPIAVNAFWLNQRARKIQPHAKQNTSTTAEQFCGVSRAIKNLLACIAACCTAQGNADMRRGIMRKDFLRE